MNMDDPNNSGRPMLARGDSLPTGSESGVSIVKDKPIRTTSFDTATLYSKQGSITTTNGKSGIGVPVFFLSVNSGN
jgi:hypothetical protein